MLSYENDSCCMKANKIIELLAPPTYLIVNIFCIVRVLHAYHDSFEEKNHWQYLEI